jgi:L-aminopeptidase/D-esterase-like protein
VLTDVDGVRVGHWTDRARRTGCTVVLLPAGTVASGEVRGGAPGTREWELLHPARLVSRVDAVVLAGGSARGLAAGDGVVRWCAERGLGLPTPSGAVPIVVGCVLYDLGVGEASAYPDADAGYAACVAAVAGHHAVGPVGAGTGATVGKWRGPGAARDAGIGAATVRGHAGLVVSALVACNAWGEPRDPAATPPPDLPVPPEFVTQTTIGVVATNARLEKTACYLVAQSGHDGLARALHPVHTVFDGDAIVAVATGTVAAPAPGPLGVEVVRALAAEAVELATRAAVPS